MADNIILVAGKGGRAAFQNHLVRYLVSAEKNFSTALMAGDGEDGEAILDEWRNVWREGGCLKGPSEPKAYAFRVQPLRKHKDKPPLDFAFFEIKVEDLAASPVEQAGAKPALPAKLATLIGKPQFNFVLVLLCDRNEKTGQEAGFQDASLSSLVACLKSECGEAFVSRCPVLLLACGAGEGGGDQGVEVFASHALPATLSALQDWQGRYTLGELDMGEFEADDDGAVLLDAPKFDDTGKVFRWIYFQFTRYPVVEPFLARLWKSVRRSAS